MTYKFKGEVWRWPGLGGWHFMNVPKAISEKIRKTAKTYGAGFVKVEVKIGKSTWRTALFPDKRSGTYLVSIKASIRKKEKIWERDIVSLSFKLI